MNTPARLPGDILALVTSTSPWSAAATAAVALAAKCQANVSACYVDASLRMLHGGEAEPSVLALLMDAPTENASDRDAFVSLARDAGVPHAHWMVTRASIAATLRQLGAWHDLVVIDRELVEESVFFEVLGEALMMCRSPSLLLPSGWKGAPLLERIVLAWNGSLEAIRAMHAALPFLQMAKETVLIDGESPHYEDDQPRAPHFDAVAYLASHGVRAQTRRLHVAPHEAGDALLRETVQVHGDLLVMGAYGHSRVRERVLGGATRHVLQHARVPVLMQH